MEKTLGNKRKFMESRQHGERLDRIEKKKKKKKKRKKAVEKKITEAQGVSMKMRGKLKQKKKRNMKKEG